MYATSQNCDQQWWCADQNASYMTGALKTCAVSLICCPLSAANKGCSIQQPDAGIQSCKSAQQQSTGKPCHNWTVWPWSERLRVPGALKIESRDAGQQPSICRQACIEACRDKRARRTPNPSPQGLTTS
ncbi:TPA: hypothetical protein ACH3X2_003170 [Trebouxia sp. C0005]